MQDIIVFLFQIYSNILNISNMQLPQNITYLKFKNNLT